MPVGGPFERPTVRGDFGRVNLLQAFHELGYSDDGGGARPFRVYLATSPTRWRSGPTVMAARLVDCQAPFPVFELPRTG